MSSSQFAIFCTILIALFPLHEYIRLLMAKVLMRVNQLVRKPNAAKTKTLCVLVVSP
ncbi:hypothetical protein N665_0369s0003 [Sinapis alba]|nr:hypothetical protein N665_0369s0003 [Sinapis alba]